MTQHNFTTSIEGIELRVIGYFDSDGNYEIEDVLQDGTDIEALLADHVVHEIHNRAVKTLEREVGVVNRAVKLK